MVITPLNLQLLLLSVLNKVLTLALSGSWHTRWSGISTLFTRLDSHRNQQAYSVNLSLDVGDY